MKIFDCHAFYQLAYARFFFAAVEPKIAIPLINYVVMLGIKPTRNFWVFPKSIHHSVVIPTPIYIARAAFVAPNIATFGVDIWHIGLFITVFVMKFAAHKGFFVDCLQMFFPTFACQIFVPCINIGFGMPRPAANGIVFHQTSGIQTFCQTINRSYPFLGFGQIDVLLFAVNFLLSFQSPRFVEGYPRKNSGMIIISFYHFTECKLRFLAGIFVGFAPKIGQVRHHQNA